MNKALTISKNYFNEYGTLPPMMVVAESASGDTYTWLGRFRPSKIGEDQKVFCGLMQTAFSIYGIQSYTCILPISSKVSSNPTSVDETILAVSVSRDPSMGRIAKVFKRGSDNEFSETLSIEPYDFLDGMYLKLLPEKVEMCDPTTAKNITSYLARLEYAPPSMEEVVQVSYDGLKFLLETGLD
jgi:hypothetical protein